MLLCIETPVTNAQTGHEGTWKTVPFEDLEVVDGYLKTDSQGVEWWHAILRKSPEYPLVDIVGYDLYDNLFLSYTFRDNDIHGYLSMPVGWRYAEAAYTSTEYAVVITRP